MTPQTTTPATKRGRGRPTIEHDNSRVRTFLRAFDSATDIRESLPDLDDALIGVLCLQPEGQASTRSLSMKRLLHVLQHCKTISTEAVETALGPAYSLTQVKRYTLAARVASKVVEHNLNQRPAWNTLAQQQMAGVHLFDLNDDLD
jgi:hypothetical protein